MKIEKKIKKYCVLDSYYTKQQSRAWATYFDNV